ncbi:hypothetical protein ACLOAU_23110 [Niabella sp. CJ426]|uniref:hypothetical protein n=1 Tax=Niabella sp. CJ426 TaxID=3393740 RepID=UPI003CFBE6C6
MVFNSKQPGIVFFLILLIWKAEAIAQNSNIISKEDLVYLKGITRAVLDSSRIRPAQLMPPGFGMNNTGGTLIRPGGRATYPAFWIRDYAMSLETGMVSAEEQRHMLKLTAATQCDQTWITKGGSMVPYGAIADHILVDNSMPVYFAGTYELEQQGTHAFGMFPPYCDQFYFIKMAYHYVKSTADLKMLNTEINGISLISRLETAFHVPPSDRKLHIVHSIENYRAVDFGFRDAIHITGDLLYPSLLKYEAALELSELFKKSGNTKKALKYKDIATAIKAAIAPKFADEDGMLRASTGKSAQRDVWGTALAVYMNLLPSSLANKASQVLAIAYKTGNLAYKGAIRHVMKTDDFSSTTSWEGAIPETTLNSYQNGAYWFTATGWVAYAISKTDKASARKLAQDYITELRLTDYRRGSGFAGPLECFHPPSYTRGPVYLTSVSCPYIVFNKMMINE